MEVTQEAETPHNRHQKRAQAAMARRKAAYTVRSFCEEFGVSKSYTYNLIRANELDARKIGTKTIITGESAHRWFAALPEADIRRESATA